MFLLAHAHSSWTSTFHFQSTLNNLLRFKEQEQSEFFLQRSFIVIIIIIILVNSYSSLCKGCKNILNSYHRPTELKTLIENSTLLPCEIPLNEQLVLDLLL